MTSQAWVADRSVRILQQDPSIGAKKLQKELQDMYNCTIRYDTVWKGKDRAIDKMYGSWGQSFQYLWNFKAEIEKRSPGSLVEIDVKTMDGKVYFSRFFMAFKPCIEGFLAGCRPYVSVDSTALNGKWNGHLAACTALDGHNWMFPVAFAFIDSETDANWTWFMTQLSRALGPIDTIAICTDACKGLESAVQKVFPQADKRECFRHLMSNFMKKFHGDSFAHMWPAAKAYRPEVFDHHMLKVLQACPDVGGYLSKHHRFKWMRSSFNTQIKCDYIHNNLAEVFNSWIKDIKDLPVDELADTIRAKIMRLFDKRRTIGEKLRGNRLPAIIQQLNNKSRGLGHLKVGRSSAGSCEVRDVNQNNIRHVVKIDMHECTCLEWQHTGKPCEHALAFLLERRNVNFEDYVHEYFSLERFRAAYAGEIEPLTDRSQWPKVHLGFVMLPPIYKNSAGRRRKLRIKGCLEHGGNGSKPSGSGSKHRCKQCGELGHRRAACPRNGTKKRKRKSRPVHRGEDQLTTQTPSRQTISLPAILQDSPGPITRRRLALAVAEDASQPCETTYASAAKVVDMPETSKARRGKKLTPKKKNRV